MTSKRWSVGELKLKAAVRWVLAEGGFVRSAAAQAQKIAAPCINDRFSRGIAAVEGYVLRSKGGLCKVHKLRRAVARANMS